MTLDGNPSQNHNTITALAKYRPAYKIGLKAIYRGDGMELARDLKKLGHTIFLDAKLFDVGFTMVAALKEIVTSINPDIVTVRTNNLKALNACKRLLPTVAPVLHLTEDRTLIDLDLVTVAVSAGITHVVCPISYARRAGLHFPHVICPGIGAQGGTPAEARVQGAKSIVVGRAITEAPNISLAYAEYAAA